MYFVDSNDFFQIPDETSSSRFSKARLCCVKDFLKRVLCFPITLTLKVYRTVLRALFVLISLSLVFCTLGLSQKTRILFIDRVVCLAKDLADWVLLPFAISLFFVRFFLGLLVHPNLYFTM